MKATPTKRFIRLAAAAAIALSASGCAGRVALRGNLPDADHLAQIHIGQTAREEVAEILGSPSTVTPFDSELWLYISEKDKTVAFLPPKVVERNIIMVRFDKKGVVKQIKKLDLSNGRDIEEVKRVTPTSGNEISFWDQLFGNLGRFNGGAGASSLPGGPTGLPGGPGGGY